MVFVFLQNAWSPLYAGKTWPRRSWLKALSASRSGVRLQKLVGKSPRQTLGSDVEFHNTTPIVGDTSASVVPPDADYVGNLLKQSPTIVVACGKQAEKCLSELWSGPLLAVPHPAHRLLTDSLYEAGQRWLTTRLSGGDVANRLRIKQQNGFFEFQEL